MKIYYDSDGNIISEESMKNNLKNIAINNLKQADILKILNNKKYSYIEKDLRKNSLAILTVLEIENMTKRLLNDFKYDTFLMYSEEIKKLL